MAKLNLGTRQGLAVDMQFDDRINDLRYDEIRHKRALGEAESRAKMFAEDLDYQNAANKFDMPRIKQIMNNKITNIGKFYKDNPDVLYNPMKRTQLNLMKKELKDDPDLIRALTTDSNIKALYKDLQEVAKNPQRYNIKAYDSLRQQVANYEKYGNPYGQEAAAKEGLKPFIYEKPRDFVDINDRWIDIGNKFKDVKTRPIKGGRNAYEEYADPNSLNIVAQEEYLQNKEQYDIEAARNGINPIEMIKSGINAHIPKKRDFGDYGLSDQFALLAKKRQYELDDKKAESKGGSSYQESFVKREDGWVPIEGLEQTYGSKPGNYLLYDNKGQQQIDITGSRAYYTGNHRWMDSKDKDGRPHRQKYVETYTYLTPESAAEKGIYSDGWNPFAGEEITPEWNRQAEIVRDRNEKGEEQKMIKVKSWLPVEINEAYAGRFDNTNHIAKSKVMGQQPNESAAGGVQDGAIVVDNNTGQKYRKVPGGYEPIN